MNIKLNIRAYSLINTHQKVPQKYWNTNLNTFFFYLKSLLIIYHFFFLVGKSTVLFDVCQILMETFMVDVIIVMYYTCMNFTLTNQLETIYLNVIA